MRSYLSLQVSMQQNLPFVLPPDLLRHLQVISRDRLHHLQASHHRVVRCPYRCRCRHRASCCRKHHPILTQALFQMEVTSMPSMVTQAVSRRIPYRSSWHLLRKIPARNHIFRRFQSRQDSPQRPASWLSCSASCVGADGRAWIILIRRALAAKRSCLMLMRPPPCCAESSLRRSVET